MGLNCRLDVQKYINDNVKKEVLGVGTLDPKNGFGYVTKDFGSKSTKVIAKLNKAWGQKVINYTPSSESDMPGTIEVKISDSLVQFYINKYGDKGQQSLFDPSVNSPFKLSNRGVDSNLTEVEKQTMYDNYSKLMDRKRSGFSLSKESFNYSFERLSLLEIGDSKILGEWDVKNQIFKGRIISSPSIRSLYVDILKIKDSLNFMASVPPDMGKMLSKAGFYKLNIPKPFEFKRVDENGDKIASEWMDKYLFFTDEALAEKAFNKPINKITKKDVGAYDAFVNKAAILQKLLLSLSSDTPIQELIGQLEKLSMYDYSALKLIKKYRKFIKEYSKQDLFESLAAYQTLYKNNYYKPLGKTSIEENQLEVLNTIQDVKEAAKVNAIYKIVKDLDEFVYKIEVAAANSTVNIDTLTTPEIYEQLENNLNKTLVSFLENFGVTTELIESAEDTFNIDTLTIADILNKVLYVDKNNQEELPEKAMEIITYMMQYNPIVSEIMKHMDRKSMFRRGVLTKEQKLKAVSDLITEELYKKTNTKLPKDLKEKLELLWKQFIDFLDKFLASRVNRKIGYVADAILLQNQSLITASLYKPGEFGRNTKQVTLKEAMEKDSFGKTIIKTLSKEGFLLVGSTALGEQGSIQRPEENPLHDIDWRSPFSLEVTKEKFFSHYPKAVFVRNIYSGNETTTTYLVPPQGTTIQDYTTKKVGNKIVVTGYNIVNETDEIIGRYSNLDGEDLTTDVAAKLIDFFVNPTKETRQGIVVMGVQLAHWKDIFDAKLRYARYKDIWDYNRFTPNNRQQDETIIPASSTVNKTVQEETQNLFDPAVNPSKTIEPKFDKILNLRDNQLKIAKTKKAEIKRDKKTFSTDKQVYKKLVILENKVDSLIKELENDIAFLKKTPTIDVLKYYIQADISRLEILVKSKQSLDIQEAKDIIHFYSKIYDFDSPFFTKEDIDSEEFTPIKESLNTIITNNPVLKADANPMQIALHYKNVLEAQARENILNKVNKDSRVRNTFRRELTDEELFADKGAKDIGFIDTFIMDPQFSIGEANPVLTQYRAMVLEDSLFRHQKYSQNLINSIREIEENVKKALPKRKSGIFSDADYNMFRAKDSNGLLSDNIISRFTSRVFEIEKDLNDKWKRKRDSNVDLDNESKRISFDKQKREMFNWYRENFIFIEIDNIQEIVDMYPEFFQGKPTMKNANYEDSLKKMLGEQYGYREEVDKQIKLLNEYKVQYELEVEKLNIQLANQEVDLKEYQKQLYYFESNFSPVEFLKNVRSAKTPNTLDYNKIYLSKIPRKFKGRLNKKTNFIENTGVETEYWDKDFAKIEANSDLKTFHTLLRDFIEEIASSVHPDERSNFNVFSIPAIEKGFMESLSDPRLSIWENLSELWRTFLNTIRDLFATRLDNSLSFSQLDPLTGKPLYKISSQDLQFNKKKIDNKYLIEAEKMKHAVGIIGKGSVPTLYDLTRSNQAVISILAENLGVAPNLSAIQKRLPNSNLNKFELKRTLLKSITHQVISNNTLDLPKVLKVASYSLALYKARHENLPTQILIKDIYDAINTPDVNKEGEQNEKEDGEKIKTKDTRGNAIKQSNAWFKRAILGDYEKTNPIKTSSFRGLSKLVDNFFKGKVPSSLRLEEYKTEEDIDKLIQKLQETIEQENVKVGDEKDVALIAEVKNKMNQIEKIKEAGLKYVSFTTMVNNIIYRFSRFMGLGYNVSAAMTNFFEGQMSNMLNAASGRYFKEENYWRALDVIKYSMLKNTSKHLFNSTNTPFIKDKMLEAELARKLMDNFDILQDAYNELQKASSESKMDNLTKFHPKEITNRIEYQNQAPIMLAILMETEIKNSAGKTSNVWDEMLKGAEQGKPVGSLSNEFSTPENKLNFEVMSKKEMETIQKDKSLKIDSNFKVRITETIVKLHGDYNQLRGNLASENIVGQGLMMFKRWLGMYMYNRFGTEQYNLRLEKKEKGRFRSFDTPTAAMYGAIAGGSVFGPIGIAAGFAGGIAVHQGAKIFKIGAENIYTPGQAPEITALKRIKEMAVVTTVLLKRVIGLPTNVIAGKQLIDAENLNVPLLKNWKAQYESGHNKLDVENIKANIAEMSMQLWMVAMVIAAKVLLWDEEDEKSDGRRIAHNIVLNKILGLSGQSYIFFNLGKDNAYDNFLGEAGAMRTIANFVGLIDSSIDFLEGKDIKVGGPNSGESALQLQLTKTFLPSPMRGLGGFKSSSERVFSSPSWLTKMGKTPEDDAKFTLSQKKAVDKLRYITDDLSKEEKKARQKQLDRYYRKSKGQSYERKLEIIKDSPFFKD